ncbi:MAG: extracellular solute-binding protein [Steroidobacteraceae bacterium]
MPTHRAPLALLGVLALVVTLAGAARRAAAGESVNVLYAGSLVHLMEDGVRPAFDRASGDHFRGFAGGSKQLAREIAGRLRPVDVFVSANPKVNAMLTGAAHGAWESWYVDFAQSPLVIGYARASRFAADFRSKPWYRVLLEPGIRIGRTDPKLDPKGALTLQLLERAETFYHEPGLAQRVLGAPENAAQVLPEDALVGRLQTGLIDAGFFYSTETASAGIPTVALPAAIAPKAVYTVTILRDAPHPAAAARFVAFLLGPGGRQALVKFGLTRRKLTLVGDAGAVPQPIRVLAGTDTGR